MLGPGRGRGGLLLVLVGAVLLAVLGVLAVGVECDGGRRLPPGGGGAQRHALDDPLVMGPQALEHGYQGPVAGGGHHVGRVLAGLQEDGHDDPGHFALAGVLAQAPPDDLNDVHGRTAGVREHHGPHPALPPDVDPFTEHPATGEHTQLGDPSVRVDPVREPAQDRTAVDGGVLPGQPFRTDPPGVGDGVGGVELGGRLR